MHTDCNLTKSCGLGFYPDDDCYDPDRSSWLPYWINSPTEEACFLAHLVGSNSGANYTTKYSEPSAPPPVTSPDVAYKTTAQGGSGATPAEIQAMLAKQAADEQKAWNAQSQAQMNKLADTLPKTCEWYQTHNSAGACVPGGMWLYLLLGGGAAALILLRRV